MRRGTPFRGRWTFTEMRLSEWRVKIEEPLSGNSYRVKVHRLLEGMDEEPCLPLIFWNILEISI
jgi:hypothetical protein